MSGDEKRVILPMVHLNGTSVEALLEQNVTAMQALEEAMLKLVGATPNGRDYYPMGPGVICEVQDQHYDRLRRLKSVYDELKQIAEYLFNEQEKRRKG